VRLSLYTDFSLRLLMYLAAAGGGRLVTTAEVARAYGISVHHLQKAATGLTHAGYVEAVQGRAGGLRLAVEPALLRLGDIVARLEEVGCLVDCARGPCPLAGRCALKGMLDQAERRFVDELNRFTLADAVGHQTGKAIDALSRQAASEEGDSRRATARLI
jgi:Rrf2 family transcriptional regulator, nitric oxide-sensitive transcriptional repressor